MINQVVLIGRVTKDIELKTFLNKEESIKKVDFQLAVNSADKKVDYFNCVVFRKLAENMQKFLHKGSQIALVGKLKTNQYEKDGKKTTRTFVIVNTLEFLDTKTQKN